MLIKERSISVTGYIPFSFVKEVNIVEDYKPNSHKYKEEQAAKKEIKKVVTGTVTKKKKSGLVKLVDVFIQEDIEDVKSFIVRDIIIPTGKQLLSDIVNGILYPGGGGPRKATPASRVQYTNYSGYSRDRDRDRYDRREPKKMYEYDQFEFDYREDAENVIMGMDEILQNYPFVKVSDMYELAEVSCDYTAHNYGWTDISSARTERTRYGKYVIRLPRPMPIER